MKKPLRTFPKESITNAKKKINKDRCLTPISNIGQNKIYYAHFLLIHPFFTKS